MRASVAELYGAALRGSPVQVVDSGGARPLALPRWRSLTPSDQVLLAACDGETLDVGCGPGRMTAALAAAGVPALGIDLVSEAVRETRRRGGQALLRDVFGDLPGDGRWRTVLLADGNVGIGGDVLRLLRRVSVLLDRGGRAVLDVSAPGRGATVRQMWLAGCGRVSEPFRWASICADTIEPEARRAGLRLVELRAVGDSRWMAVLVKEAR